MRRNSWRAPLSVAALSAVVDVTVFTIIAMVLFVGAAALGGAAQWPRRAVGGGSHRTIEGMRSDGWKLGSRRANNGLANAVQSIRDITDARSNLVRIGVIVQVTALAVLVLGYAINLDLAG